ncbi:hypothetical protein [Neptuniibacter sp. QD34_54]|uniref:hypothetical protein n=1 Tax=Neptuniibacter sp. QD34_54 TaxID=3398208 RepID=UPI0039F5060B
MADFVFVNELTKGAVTFVTAGFGAFVSVGYLQLKAKRDEWFWKKRVEGEEKVISSVSKLQFISSHYLNSEFSEKYSMAGMGLGESETAAIALVRELHEGAFEITPYLRKYQRECFENFLNNTQSALDEAKEDWRTVDQDDPLDMERNAVNLLAALEAIASSALEEFKVDYENRSIKGLLCCNISKLMASLQKLFAPVAKKVQR